MKRSRRHALGQHFLVNRSLLERIVRVIDPRPDDLVVEIGPGKGALTTLLTERAGRVVAVEKDAALASGLAERGLPNLTVVAADILETDLAAIVSAAGGVPGRAKLAGNLPYSASSPILFLALESRTLFSSCVFLLQKEVAERVCGRPGTKDHSPLSILFQNGFEARIALRVAPGSFSPPPKVDSALLTLSRRDAPLFPEMDEPAFRGFLRAAFAHRRKLLAGALELGGIPRPRFEEARAALGLPSNVRAEELPAAALVALHRALR